MSQLESTQSSILSNLLSTGGIYAANTGPSYSLGADGASIRIDILERELTLLKDMLYSHNVIPREPDVNSWRNI